MSDGLPEKPRPPTPPVERTLSSQDFELVIRRAAELQARESEREEGAGMTEAEALRIGRELGLSTRHLHQALAEVSVSGAVDEGLLNRLFGNNQIRVGRAVQGEAGVIASRLEDYLVQREFLAVLRRFPDRVSFTRATGVAAAIGRASSQIFSRSPLLKVANLEMSVHQLEEGFAYVSLATSLGSQRLGTAAGTILGGGAVGAAVGTVLGIAIAPPLALVGVPVLGGAMLIGHVAYGHFARSVEVQLESLLDRVEHRELPPPMTGWSRGRRRR